MKKVSPESYRASHHVYVEDPLTHDVLSGLWADTQVNLFVRLHRVLREKAGLPPRPSSSRAKV